MELDQLGEQDARDDGFESLEALHAALLALYPDHAVDGKRWFRVCFRMRDAAAPSAP